MNVSEHDMNACRTAAHAHAHTATPRKAKRLGGYRNGPEQTHQYVARSHHRRRAERIRRRQRANRRTAPTQRPAHPGTRRGSWTHRSRRRRRQSHRHRRTQRADQPALRQRFHHRTAAAQPPVRSRIGAVRKGNAADGRRIHLHRTPAHRHRRSRTEPGRRHSASQQRHRAGAACRRADRARRRPEGHQSGRRRQLQGAGKVLHRPDRRGQGRQTRPGDRARSGDPSRHPDPLPPHQEQPGADRRARRGQNRRRRRTGPAHRRRRCAHHPAEQEAHLARPGLHGGRLQIPWRIRGTLEERAGRDQERQRADHHVHRRDPHHRGRRRSRRLHGRGQHAQAHAGPRRTTPDRRHHTGRIPREHRKGPGARTPLPAGVRRRAKRGGHHRHPARHRPQIRSAPQGHHRRRRAGRSRNTVEPLHLRPPAARQGHRPGRRSRSAPAHGTRLLA